MKIETLAVHGAAGCDPRTGAISFPIYQSATFKHPGLNQSTGYDYSRELNPTREELEKTIATLEGGGYGLAFSSGMAAVSAVLGLFSPGDHFIVSDDLYGGTYRLFEQQRKIGFAFNYIDTTEAEKITAALTPKTRCIFIETPSNPIMKVTDIRAVTELAKNRGILTVCDNTFLTPYYQQPLELGADIVLHSATKFLGGHNDTLAGLVVVKDDGMADSLKLIQKSTGAVLGPFDSWLILRGIKTLGIRMDRQQQNALKIAAWLGEHPHVSRVYYVGLPHHERYETSRKQTSGFGAMISFEVTRKDIVEKILKNVRLISFAESLGGVESLITYPLVQTHAAIPKEILDSLGVNEKLLRLSVGIEAVEDLIDDLEQAMR